MFFKKALFTSIFAFLVGVCGWQHGYATPQLVGNPDLKDEWVKYTEVIDHNTLMSYLNEALAFRVDNLRLCSGQPVRCQANQLDPEASYIHWPLLDNVLAITGTGVGLFSIGILGEASCWLLDFHPHGWWPGQKLVLLLQKVF